MNLKKMTVTLSLILASQISNSAPSVLKFGDPLPANAFVELAKLINPSVVNISTTTNPKYRGGGRDYQNDPFFDMLQQFYGMPLMPNAQPQKALGTGFIIREDGLIVTNNHVIAGADSINVQLTENTTKFYDAKLIGSDERTDIALIKITPKEKLTAAQLGVSKDVEVGEWVAAFGNPFGNGHTITKGIISAKGRDINEINRFPLLQTDTPINPGNSGGPLVNLKGLVIGVNSAIQAQAQGIGFAIPIDEVKNIIPQLEKNGHLKKGYLGVGLAGLDPRAAMQLGLKDTSGALVLQVEKGSPAETGGLRTYDIITDFNGKKIIDPGSLTDAISDAEIGSKVKITVIRDGQIKNLETVIAERSIKPKSFKEKTQKFSGQSAPGDLGFSVINSNPEIRKNYKIDDEYGEFPVIVSVVRKSKADSAGFEAGDVVLEVNKKRVSKPEDIFKNIKKGTNTLRVVKQDTIVLLILDN